MYTYIKIYRTLDKYSKYIVFCVQHIGYQDIQRGDDFTLVWSEALEARPLHVVKHYGENREETARLISMRGDHGPVGQAVSSDAAGGLPSESSAD